MAKKKETAKKKAPAKKTTKKKVEAKKAAPKKKATAKKAPKKTTAKKSTAKKTSKKTAKETTKSTKSVDVASLSKNDIIESFATKEGDTGSPEVQIALSSQKIANLTGHLKENPKDNHSRRGLLKIIAKRRRILHYLQDIDKARYTELIAKLGLKK